jgi:hypothetical protein
MRSKRVAQTCDVIPGRCDVVVTARHDLEEPPTTLRICVDTTVEMHRGALAKVPGSAVPGQGR